MRRGVAVDLAVVGGVRVAALTVCYLPLQHRLSSLAFQFVLQLSATDVSA